VVYSEIIFEKEKRGVPSGAPCNFYLFQHFEDVGGNIGFTAGAFG